jgi:tetratricopeptide (TPR) repeat protein
MKYILLSLIGLGLLGMEASAQDEKYGDTEEQILKCKEALSLYRTYRDQDQTEEAYKHWRTACKECPEDVTERLYYDGIQFVKEKMDDESLSPEKQKVFFDSLMILWDMRIRIFGVTEKDPKNGCDLKGQKATDMLRNNKDMYEEALQLYKEAVDCLKEEARATYITNYYQLKYNKFARMDDGPEREVLREELLFEYLDLQGYCDHGILNNTNDKIIKGYESSKAKLDEYFLKLAQDCEHLIPVLEHLVNSDPKNLKKNKDALKLLNMMQCADSDFYMKVALAVCAAEPSCECNYNIGMGYAKQQNVRKALEYIEKGINNYGDCENKEKMLLTAAQLSMASGMTGSARTYANKVLDVNPNSGEALMVIGDVIAASTCEDKMEGRSVYWLACDYYARAKAKDSSLADKVDKKIASWQRQFPTTEQMFFISKTEGDTFDVCGMGTTTCRARN